MEYPFIMYDAARDRLDFKQYPAGYRYQVWGSPYMWDSGREADRDMEYLRGMYPKQTRTLQMLVEEECEKQDYEGSPMYDEYPDKTMVWAMCSRIRERAQKEGVEEEDLSAEAVPGWEPGMGPDGFRPGGPGPVRPPRPPMPPVPPEPPRPSQRPPRRPPQGNSLLDQMILVLLSQEMYRRRCRKRDCRRWF